MGRSLIDHFKAVYFAIVRQFSGKAEPVEVRVASTKMTHNRLKALETPDYLKEKHEAVARPPAPESSEFQLLSTEEEVSKRVKTTADMSHYRLAALKAVLPPEMQEEAQKQEEPLNDNEG